MTRQTLLLSLRIAVRQHGWLPPLALLLCLAAGAAWAWLLPARSAQQTIAARAVPQLGPAPLQAAPSADQNLAAFYATLGEQQYAEQQIKQIFALAGRTGVTLSSGQYKSSYDENGRFTAYKITLPVKGSYALVWQFCMEVLAAIPFAALDEVSFKRETAGDPVVEGRLSFTLYLKGNTP
ncbi:hypothetical protein [Massilia sp. TS11]|uniref:hypothetical protein n=1 Tax=Massilia sp. TS11 TaxID=2908003 RepID=UPI001EDB1FD9|nr:hypothetical protein [Massilia sp. TS11]MCG2586559.1 hypothetical protein [Massilia sp. TS11]